MRFLKGVVLTESGKTDDAIATLSGLTQEFPELPEPYNNLAALYASQNQYDKARTALEMAVRLNPAYATAHENLGDIYAKLASQSYAKSLQLNGNNPQATQKAATLRDLLAPQTKAKAAAKPAAK
jgi:tetratricopeptide (TPR) repeat protein